jgi:hypothetical protein
MKTDRLQAGQVFEAVGLIEQTQTASSQGFVKPGKSASSPLRQSAASSDWPMT